MFNQFYQHIIIMKKNIIILLPTIWFIVHWIVPRIYIPLCVPKGLNGFIQSMFLTTSPHCIALRYMMTLASFNINYAWISLGTVVLSFLFKTCNVQRPIDR